MPTPTTTTTKATATMMAAAMAASPTQTDAARVSWFEASGARRMMLKSSVSFNQYVQRSATLLSPEFEEDQRQIDLDVPRAVLSICDFVLGHAVSSEDNVPSELVEPIMPRIRNVLVAFSVRNPSVGYVQGHADVVCFLLGKGTATCDEEQAFWLYVCVMERVFPHDFFARSPRLHGFHVDNHLLSELVRLKLMPHSPALEEIDLLLVCSLLACKWFVSLWVGELSTDVLVQVWDTMLTEPSGSVFHLLLGLEMFSLTLDDAKDRFHTTPDEFNSSLVYKLVQTKARGIAHVDARRILANAQTLYGINEEALEDMRSNVRREPRLRHAELVVLGRHTHFSMVELARFHDEFLFLRYFSKTCDRNKLRGLRLEHFEGVIARHFPCWPTEAYSRLFQQLSPDDFGNIFFPSLMQILSTMSRGSPEERLQLLFRCSGITDDGNFPDALGSISALSELMAALLANRCSLVEQRLPQFSEASTKFEIPTQREILKKLVASQEQAQVQGRQVDVGALRDTVLNDAELFLCLGWDIARDAASRKSARSSRSGHKSKSRFPGTQLTSPESALISPSSPAAHIVKSSHDVRHLTLLSKQMRKKFRSVRLKSTSQALLRNPFKSTSSPLQHGRSGNAQVFWCQCTIC